MAMSVPGKNRQGRKEGRLGDTPARSKPTRFAGARSVGKSLQIHCHAARRGADREPTSSAGHGDVELSIDAGHTLWWSQPFPKIRQLQVWKDEDEVGLGALDAVDGAYGDPRLLV